MVTKSSSSSGIIPMTAADFIQKWQNSINYLGLPSVGIHVGWDIIPADSKVDRLSGEEAWNKIYSCTPPWFKTPKNFRQLVDAKDADYSQIVKEETDNGKIEYYRQKGLQEPLFCAFATEDGSFMLLGDGNHRFLDCIHLIHDKNHNFNKDLTNTTLDVIYLANFNDVVRPDNIWANWNNNE